MNHARLGFIGLGNMAEAFMTGLLKNTAGKPPQITGLEIQAERATQMQNKFGLDLAADMRTLCEASDVILFCVKPQQSSEALAALAPHCAHKLFISIAAGIEIKTYTQALGKSARIIRAMPNAPALLGLGVTGFFSNKNTTATDRELAKLLFETVGIACEVKSEKLLNAITAVSGSGPAFVYKYAQSALRAAQKVGLKKEEAQRLTFQTMAGAIAILQHSSEDIDILIRKVASPGGTTEAGLKALEKNHFEKAIASCIFAATKRSEELAQLSSTTPKKKNSARK